MKVNWLYVGLAACLAYVGVAAVFAAKRRWTWAAMGVAATNFLFVLVDLVAPFRGLLDPEYRGFNAGWLHIAPGPMVTVVSGSIVAAALASACIALLNRPGPRMAFIACVDTVLLVVFGLPELVSGLMAPEKFRIELGEYLQIPGLIAVLIIGSLFCLPLVASIVWSARRIRPAS